MRQQFQLGLLQVHWALQRENETQGIYPIRKILTKTRHTCTHSLSSLLILCSPTKVAGNGTDQACG